MNDVVVPPVPELSSDWIRLRRDRLVREITRPPRRQISPRLALGGIGALAAVAATTAVVLIVFSGARATNAFAGWTATPTQPTSGQTASALAECRARLDGSVSEQSGFPTSGWQPVVTDTRGPFTAIVLQSAGATATCLSGPSFTTTSANASEGGASQHIVSSGSAIPSAASISAVGLGGPTGGPISQATAQLASSDGQPYTFLQGQVETGVNGLTLVLSDGTHVEATIAGGLLLAWWPGNATPTSAQAATSSGTTTQQLNFTPVSPPNAAGPTTPTTTRSP